MTPPDFSDWPDDLACPHGPVPAIVLEVHDGDTVKLLVGLDFGARVEAWVRLYGIDAPELSTPAGRSARDFLAMLLRPGDRARLVSLVGTTGEQERSFARYVGTVEALVAMDHLGNRHAADVAAAMVDAGHAIWVDRNLRPLPGPPPPIPRWKP